MQLLSEWQVYVGAMVETSDIMAPADAASFMADLPAGVQRGTALQAQRLEEERAHNWNLQYAVLHPIQRPENGHTPVQNRWSPLERKP